MRFSKFVSVFVLGLTFSLRACFAADWIPELESPEITRECGLDFAWYPSADSTRRTVLLNKVLDQARSLYSQKKYKEALERAQYANKVEKHYLNDEVIAECLAHIARPVEALAMLNKLPYSSWEARVEVYETLGMYKQALKACALPDANIEPYVLKCTLLLKHGDRAQAINLAQSAYFKFTCYGQEAPQVVKFFRDNGLPLPEPRAVSESPVAIAALISNLPQIPEPKSPEDLRKLFARKFSISGRNQTGLSYCSDERFEAPICRIYLRGPDGPPAPNERTLSFEVNVGTAIFKRSDIQKLLHDVGTPTESESQGVGSGPTIVENIMEYSLPDACLRFTFSGPDKNLMEFSKAWAVPGAETRVTSRKAKPSQFTPPSLLAIKKEISSFHYKKAARDLMIAWGTASGSAAERAEHREIFSQCYQLLKKPEVADYIRIAPWRHINRSIIETRYDPDKLDLTLDTYMHRLWNVQGPAEKDKGCYRILIPNVESPSLFQAEDPALYAKLFELIGPLAAHQDKKIAPIPAELIDGIDFHDAPN